MGVVNRIPIVTNGLVVNLDAGNYKSYPKSGTAWNDISLNNNNGTLINGPVFNPENAGYFLFDGVNDYCSTPYFGSNTGTFTYSAWAQTSATDSLLWCRGREGAGSGFSIALSMRTNGAVSSTVVVDGSQLEALSATGYWRPNEWGYFTGVWQPTVALSVYFNGNLVARTPTIGTTLRSSTEGWILASIGSGGGFYYNSKIANATIYSRALLAQEVSQNYNSLKSRFNL
jgi:hypothetical protein